MKLGILLFCCVAAFGQEAASAPQSGKLQTQDYGLGVGAFGKQFGALDVLSDTQGVDFGPYLTEVVSEIRTNWYHLMPESAMMKRGKLAIEFTITKKGNVADMRLVARTEDVTLDRAAWGSITASDPVT